MADAFIYYRLASNSSNKEGASNTPALLKTNFPSQVLEFTLPDELLESVSMMYENNVKDSPVSEPDGTRRINKQDNGLMGIRFTFRGRFREASSDITTLISFAKILQVESTTATNALGFGKFGFYTDNTTIKPFNVDPDKNYGLTIKSFNINRTGQTPKNFDFEIIMTFGGTF